MYILVLIWFIFNLVIGNMHLTLSSDQPVYLYKIIIWISHKYFHLIQVTHYISVVWWCSRKYFKIRNSNFFLCSVVTTDLVLKESIVIFPFELHKLHVSVFMLSISHILKSNQGKCVLRKFAQKINSSFFIHIINIMTHDRNQLYPGHGAELS